VAMPTGTNIEVGMVASEVTCTGISVARSIKLAKRLGCRVEGLFDHTRLGPMQIWRHLAP
jgi:hypothetical protein